MTIPRRVVANGFDAAVWRPQARREQTVLVVGRVTPEKGLLEAARALAAILPRHPDWTTTFVVSEPGRFPDYFAAIDATLAPLGPQARLLVGRPYEEVKALNERAAIALAPSVWREPFGRTCLEAHAGGAAVVSSGSGGLREISGEAALYLAAVEPAGIAAAVEALIADAALRARLAADGRARVERLFDVRCVAAALDDFCAAAIDRANSRLAPAPSARRLRRLRPRPRRLPPFRQPPARDRQSAEAALATRSPARKMATNLDMRRRGHFYTPAWLAR